MAVQNKSVLEILSANQYGGHGVDFRSSRLGSPRGHVTPWRNQTGPDHFIRGIQGAVVKSYGFYGTGPGSYIMERPRSPINLRFFALVRTYVFFVAACFLISF